MNVVTRNQINSARRFFITSCREIIGTMSSTTSLSSVVSYLATPEFARLIGYTGAFVSRLKLDHPTGSRDKGGNPSAARFRLILSHDHSSIQPRLEPRTDPLCPQEIQRTRGIIALWSPVKLTTTKEVWPQWQWQCMCMTVRHREHKGKKTPRP